MKKHRMACIIDDDKLHTFVVKRLIDHTQTADSVISFSNGEEAITYLSGHLNKKAMLPDLIFLDLNMPVLDGWGFLDQWTAIQEGSSKKIDIFVISSSIDEADHDRAKTYPVVSRFIIKPLSKESFVMA